ncbi:MULTISPECIES: hypothetical protein [Amycolatopsis]|uniref:Uncharacterized protein n=2 Tax=Amycolatopsis TaxID=1813 RepID=A0A1I3WHM0_9PSEU|nr:hypothetical protein [Amycolatopsis sacchari]SFK06653.1 hypothetical protein SAMN05421835_11314 [Amycolatopsis sacchari]
MGTFHPNWLYGSLGGWGELYGVQLDGWLTEYRTVGEQSLVPVPGRLSFEEAATLPCLRALGASDVIDYTGTPEWGARVRELTAVASRSSATSPRVRAWT